MANPWEADPITQTSAAPWQTDPIVGQEKPRSWADVPMEAVKNIPSSAYHLGEGLVKQGVATAKAVAPYAAQGPFGPQAAIMDVGKALYNDPGMVKRFGVTAWNALVDRYGSEEAIKKTIATDPVGFALDAATIIQPGASVIGRGGRIVSEIGRTADVTRPFHEIPPAPERPPPLPPPPLPAPEDPALAAARGAVESLPRAITTENPTLQHAGQVVSKLPGIGGPLQKAVEAVPGRFGEARDVIAGELGTYRTPQNVAEDIRGTLGGVSEAEQAAAKAEAARADAAAQAAYERANLEREQAISQREQASAQDTAQQIGNIHPTVTGDVVGDTVRASHAAAEARKNAAYDRAASIEGAVKAEGMGSLYPQVMGDFAKSGRNLIPDVTPRAIALRDEMRSLSKGIIPEDMFGAHIPEAGGAALADIRIPEHLSGAHIPGAGADSISTQGLNAFRKRFNAIANAARTPEDIAASRQLMRSFDEWQTGAMEKHLASGDPAAALAAHREANVLNRDLMQRFGYNARNDADTLINKIVQPGNQVGPDDIFRALSQPGNKPGRLLDSIYEATADHPQHGAVQEAVRGGFYHKLTHDKAGAPLPPEKVATNIAQFLNNREMVNRVWGAQDQAFARRHINTLGDVARARDEAAALVKSTKPEPTEIAKGPAQQLAERILGKGEKPAEAVYSTIEDLAKGKGGGKDIATLAKVMNSLPPELQGNFLNTFVRRIGEGAKGEPFSAERFSTEWLDNINPMAKQVMLKNGAHVRALDELAAGAKKFNDVYKKYGNPTGSGHTSNFLEIAKIAGAAVASGTIALIAPMKLAGGWFAGRQFAHFLATPQGAMSASRFVRQIQKLQEAPTMANAVAANLAKTNMRNTAVSLGIANSIPETRKK